MSSADRVSELIDQWLVSLELHGQYAQLSDLAYSCVQPWPKHDRPTRWVVQIARERVLQLKQHCDTRRAAGDEQFAQSLELMLTLANLVGLQHIQRFIPLADPARANPTSAKASTSTPDFAALVGIADEATDSDPAMTETTRELPQLKLNPPAVRIKPAVAARQARATIQRNHSAASAPATHAIPPAATRGPATPDKATNVPRDKFATAATSPVAPTDSAAGTSDTQEMPIPTSRPAPATRLPGISAALVASPVPTLDTLTPAERTVIADAIRLLKWGRPWHELAELVSRIADRPGITQVRRILRTHRTNIETRAGAD